jgi:ribonuclease J
MFPKADMPGVDLVLPDFRMIDEMGCAPVAVVITHGHEDHIGGLPFFLEEYQVPVIGSRVSLEFVRARLREHAIADSVSLIEVDDFATAEIGPFKVEFIPVTHSIPGAMALAIHTAEGVIVHTGDFKLDSSPVDHRHTGLSRLAVLAEDPGVALLMSDSTNADEPGYSPSESSVFPGLLEVLHASQGKRVTVSCFSSHLHRISQILEACRITGRKVAVIGRSLKRNVEIGRRLGILGDDLESLLVSEEAVRLLPPESLCTIVTGSQGEPGAVLHQLAYQPDRFYRVGPDDVIVFSSDVIPGNEPAVNRLINRFARMGARSIYPPMKSVHASGHAMREELAALVALVRPRFFVPVHGEYRHLRAHADLAEASGAVSGSVLVLEDGDKLLLRGGRAEREETGFGEFVYVDGVVGDVSRGVLRDRRALSEDGIVVVAVTIGDSMKMVGEPELFSLGWVHDDHEEELLDQVRGLVEAEVGIYSSFASIEEVKRDITRAVERFVKEQTRRRPFVVTLVTEV